MQIFGDGVLWLLDLVHYYTTYRQRKAKWGLPKIIHGIIHKIKIFKTPYT